MQSAAPKAEHPAPLGCVTHTETSWTRVHVTDLTCQLQSLTDRLQAPEQFTRALPTLDEVEEQTAKQVKRFSWGADPSFSQGAHAIGSPSVGRVPLGRWQQGID